MYDHHLYQSMNQLGKVANPARGQLRIWSRDTDSSIPSRVSLLIVHTQAEYGGYSRDSSLFPRRRPFIPSTAIESFPSLSSRAFGYRWRSPPKVRRHKAISPQGSSSNGCSLFPHPAGRPGSSEVPRNPLTRWDVSSIPANGIFLTKKTKKKT